MATFPDLTQDIANRTMTTVAEYDSFHPRDVDVCLKKIKQQCPDVYEQTKRSYFDSDVANESLKQTFIKGVEVERQRRKEKIPILIRAKLDPERRREMEEFMSGYQVEFDESDAQDHAIARAATKCMAAVMDNDVLRLSMSRPSTKAAFAMKHIGENPLLLINNGETDTHNCLGYDVAGDTRDACRKAALRHALISGDWSQRSADVKKMVECYATRFLKNGSTDLVCGGLAQDCNVKARILRARNIHDITPRQVAMSMARSEAVIASGILMYHPCVFAPGVKNGYLPYTDFTFKRSFDDGHDMITFSGPADSQDCYVHKWSTYNAWIRGQRKISVTYNGKKYYYELSFKIAAMDHVIWMMFPVAGCSSSKVDRKLPQMSNSRTIAIYGMWYDTEHKDFGLLKAPGKRDMLAPRVVHFPRDIYDQVSRMVMSQTTNFTSSYTLKALSYHMSREMEGIKYTSMYRSDTSAIAFVASCIYEICFDHRFAMSQTIGIVNQEQTDFRERFNSCWLRRFTRTLCHSHQTDKDFFYIDQEGHTRVLTHHRISRLLSFVNLFFKDNRFNTAKYRPMLLSSMSAFVFTDNSEFDKYGLDAVAEWISAWVEDKFVYDDSNSYDDEHTALYSGKLNLREIPAESFRDNSCVIDSFVAAMRETTLCEITFPEVAARVVRSRILMQVRNAAAIIEGFRNDSMIPLSVFHVLASEYDVSIVIKCGSVAKRYGFGKQTLYMKYQNEHVVPCRRVPLQFPSFLDGPEYAEEKDVVVTEDISKLACLVAPKYDSIESENFSLYGSDYETVHLLDNIWQSAEHKTVLDPYGDFCSRPMIRNNFNWSFHTTVMVDHRDVCVYTGIAQPDASTDIRFWESAVRHRQFRFDAVIFGAQAEEEGYPLISKQCELVKLGGALCIYLDLGSGSDDSWSNLNAALSDKFGDVEICRAAPETYLSTKVIAIFRSKGCGVCDLLKARNSYVIAQKKMVDYFNRTLLQNADAVAASELIKLHIKKHLKYQGLSSTVSLVNKDKKSFVCEDLCDEIAGDALCDAAYFCEPVASTSTKLGRLSVKSLKKQLLKLSRVVFKGKAKPGAMYIGEMEAALRVDAKARETKLVAAPTVQQPSSANKDTDDDIDNDNDNDNADNSSISSSSDSDDDKKDSNNVRNKLEQSNNSDEQIDEKATGYDDSSNVAGPSSSSQADENPSAPKEVVQLEPVGYVSKVLNVINKREPPTMEDCLNYKLSIEEFITYHERVLKNLEFLCREKELLLNLFSNNYKKAIAASEKNFSVIMGHTRYETNNSTISDEYTHVWSVDKHMVMTRESYETTKDTGIIIPEFCPLLAEEILRAYPLESIQRQVPTWKLQIETIQAVAGAGKSHRMIEGFKHGDVIIVPTKAARSEMSWRLMRKHFTREYERISKIEDKDDRDEEVRELRLPVRTLYSMLLNPIPAKTLWIDEMTLHHRGAIYLVATRSYAEKIICLGDKAQTYFFSRIPSFFFYHEKIDDRHRPEKYMTKTYRCSQKVTKLASHFYRKAKVLGENNFTTENTNIGSVVFEKYSGQIVKQMVAKYEKTGSVAVISYTRGDKGTMARMFKASPHIRVNTITEFQGSEADTVILVRTAAGNARKGLFTRIDQILTAVTRAKTNFVYVSAASGDPLAKAMKSDLA